MIYMYGTLQMLILITPLKHYHSHLIFLLGLTQEPFGSGRQRVNLKLDPVWGRRVFLLPSLHSLATFISSVSLCCSSCFTSRSLALALRQYTTRVIMKMMIASREPAATPMIRIHGISLGL